MAPIANSDGGSGCGLVESFALPAIGYGLITDGNNTFDIDLLPPATGGVEYIGWSYLEVNYADGSMETIELSGNPSAYGNSFCQGSVVEAGVCVGVYSYNGIGNVNITQGGAIDLTVTGGGGGYSYDWDTDGTGDFDDPEDIIPAPAGNYSVTVMDVCGVTEVANIAVNALSGPLVSLTSKTDPFCTGGFTGDIQINLDTSCGNITYAWTGPNGFSATTEDIAGLEAGVYSLVITDDNGSTNYSYTLTDPSASAIALTTVITPVICSIPIVISGATLHMLTAEGGDSYCGGTDGSFELLINGSTGLQAIAANDGGSGCGLIESFALPALGYGLITDGNNTFDIDLLPPGTGGLGYIGWSYLEVNYADGSMETIELSGNPSAYGNSFCQGSVVEAGVCVGVYSYNGIGNVNITQGGAIDLTVTGGGGGYSYDWDTDGTGDFDDPEDIIPAPAGNYSVTVMDVCGVTEVANIAVNALSGPLVSLTSKTDPFCTGGFTGDIQINLDTSCGNITYAWTGPNGFSATTEDIAGLEAGVYSLVITDDNGSTNYSYTLTDPSASAIALTTVITPVICAIPIVISGATLHMLTAEGGDSYCGGTDGSFELLINGSTGLQAIAANDGGSGCGLVESFALPALGYGLITDGNNTFDIDLLPPGTGGLGYIGWSYLEVNYADGSMETIELSGNPSAYGNSFCQEVGVVEAGVCVGVYSYNGIGNVNITQGGAIDLTVTGGGGGYSYDWDTDGTGDFDDPEDIIPAPAGNYSVTVMDVCGVTEVANIAVNALSGPLVSLTSKTDPFCTGGFTGDIQINLDTSCGNITYAWTGPNGFSATTEDIAGLEAGVYSLVITDDNGSTNYSYTLTDPSASAIALTTVITPFICAIPRVISGATLHVLTKESNSLYCGSGTDGSFELLINGSIALQAIAANDGGSGCGLVESFALPALGYGLITDGNNTFEIDLLPLATGGVEYIGWSYLKVNYADGSMETIELSGDPSSYGSHFCSGGGTSQAGVCMGVYSYNGTGNVNITQGGAIDLTVTGGTPGYTYDWDTDGTGDFDDSEDITNAIVNNYTVVVSDACGVAETATVSVPNSGGAVVTLNNSADPTCPAGADGSFDIDLAGSCGLFSFAWTGPNGFSATTEDITGLEAGSYTVDVTDDNGTTQMVFVISDPTPDPITITSSVLDAVCSTPKTVVGLTLNMLTFEGGGLSCFQLSDGAFEFNINGSLALSAVATNDGGNGCGIIENYSLAAGTYPLIVQGMNNFNFDMMPIATNGLELLGWSNLTIDYSDGSQDIITISGYPSEFGLDQCNGAFSWVAGTCFSSVPYASSAPVELIESGSIDLTVAGGTPGYTFDWDTDGTGDFDDPEDIISAPAGNYSVTVTDVCGVTEVANIVVNTLSGPIVSLMSQTDPFCTGEFTGDIQINLDASCGDITYAWTGPNGFSATTEDIAGLEAGVYYLEITDDNGSATYSYTLTELTITISGTDEMTSMDGTINASVTGGTAGYAYSWTGTNGFSASTEDLTGLEAGIYYLTVTDAIGCTTFSQFTVSSQIGIVSYETEELNIYPNPSKDIFYLELPRFSKGQLIVLDAIGKQVIAIELKERTTAINMDHFEKGVYFIEVRTLTKKMVEKIILQ